MSTSEQLQDDGRLPGGVEPAGEATGATGTTTPGADEITGRLVAFLREIGLPITFRPLDGDTFLPGIRVEGGGLAVDEAKLLYPGDLLHEAGHLALLEPELRATQDDNVGDNGGFEMGAIAWSYAAALHLGIDPAIVFHPAGYKGGAQNMLENFAGGRYLGVPMLRWTGLCGEQYPRMERWLRL